MSDFVKRLREVWEWHRENEYTDHTLLRQSADLIEQQQKEIERLKGHLAGHEKLASRGIYYTMDEIRQRDSELVTRAVKKAVNNMLHKVANSYEGDDIKNPWCVGANHVFRLFALERDVIFKRLRGQFDE